MFEKNKIWQSQIFTKKKNLKNNTNWETQYFTMIVTFQIGFKSAEKCCITPLINKSSEKYQPRSCGRLYYKIISQIIVYLR